MKTMNPAAPIHCDENTSKLGVLILFGSITMLFITFLSTFGTMVAKELSYIKLSGMQQAILIGNACLMILSSLLFDSGFREWQSTKSARSHLFILSSNILGLVFLFGQITIWQILVSDGLQSGSNVLAGMTYLMAGAHGVHLMTGLVFVAWIWIQLYRGTPIKPLRFRLIGWYWHFLTGLWIVLLSAILILIQI